jgi:hypothetical protein
LVEGRGSYPEKWREESEEFRQGCPEARYVAAQKPYHEFYRTDEGQAFAASTGIEEQALDFDQSPEALAQHIMRVCGFDSG